MIYLPSVPEDPIRQGDIFFSVPRVDISLDRLPVLRDQDKVAESSWRDLVVPAGVQAEPITAVVSIRPVPAIVLTQDCDAIRSPDIALAEIFPFAEVEGKAKDTKKPEGWVRIITQHARVNQKWFYLPTDTAVGIPMRMAVDFRRVLKVARDDLDTMRVGYRVAKLNDVALAHFRERLSEFYRRYAYDEWYPLTKEELEVYRKASPDSEPFPWQRD